MRLRVTLTVLFLCLCGLAASPARAQMNETKPPVYTYVSQWTIPRVQWGDMAKMEQAQVDILDKLVADGTLLGYGNGEVAAHDPKGPTHVEWLAASSIAGLFKAVDALQSITSANAAMLGSGPHGDQVMISTNYDSRSGSFQNAVLRGVSTKLKPGMARQFLSAWNATIRPILEKLMAEGAIDGWSYNGQWLIKDPGRIDTVILANGPEGLDRYLAAVRELVRQNPNALVPLGDAAEPGSRYDFLLRVTATRHQ